MLRVDLLDCHPPIWRYIPEPDASGFEALQISPQAIENILPQMLQTAREKAEA